MNLWFRTVVLAALLATVPATVTFMAQGGCGGGGCGEEGEEDEEQHEGECGGGGHGGSGGGGRKGFGNNLSVPVVFAEGYGLKGVPTSIDTWLRPRPTDVNPDLTEYLNVNDIFVKGGVTYFPQRTTSHWQADWRDGVAGMAEPAVVNWGDNLTRRYWTTGSMIRIEMALYQDADDTMTAYSLAHLAGHGAHALRGATGQTYDATYRDIFTVTGRFTIQKLIARAGPVDAGVPSVSRAVYDSFTDVRPRGGCNAQVNGAGSVTYSYQWPLRQWPIPEAQKIGWWRITFSLDPVAEYTITPHKGEAPQTFVVPRNVYFEGLDASDVGGDALFGPILPSSTSSVLEIEVVARGTHGKPTPADPVTLTITPPSHGTITATGIECGVTAMTCAVTHPAGTYLPMTAVPESGYSFGAWTGDADCLDGIVVPTGNTTCSAAFVSGGIGPVPSGLHRLLVVAPAGGTIYGPGIVCGEAGGACFVDLPVGVTVGLDAVASTGSAFTGWSAECPGGTVNMAADRVCVPTFSGPSTEAPPPTGSGLVRLTIVRPSGGTVVAAGILCGDAGAACTVDMPSGGVTLGLDVVPSSGFKFAGWTGHGCGGVVTLNSSLTCTPSFSPE
jgi:hypothetical protein